MNWWTLPGPNSFVEAVVEDIREGKSVFICLPENSPGRIATRIQEVLEVDFGWISSSPEPGVIPIDFLYDLVVPDADPKRLRNEANLASEEDFIGKVIWLEEIPASDWDAWVSFFMAYERVSRSVPEAQRSYFAVKMNGAATALPIPDAVGLSARYWDGWLKRSDMNLYSTACVRERKSALETDLTIALVTALGGWDPELCSYLADFELAELLQPAELLQNFAKKRGWTFEAQLLDDQTRSRGLWQTYLGKQVPHTCFGIFLNGPRFLDHLIWRAEIVVMMPFIEEQRQRLIERNRGHVKLPFYTRFGTIDDVYDLEIWMIEYFMARSGAYTNGGLQFVSNLKEARNRLSHLAPVDPNLLLKLCQSAEESRCL